MLWLVDGGVRRPPDGVRTCTVGESLSLMEGWPVVQFDTETTGLSYTLDRLLSMQFGYVSPDGADTQVVVDCGAVDPKAYKAFMESKPLLGMNVKFDLEFMYSAGVVPRHVYDVMVNEQTLYLGYKSGSVGFGLHDIAMRRLGVDVDKSYQSRIACEGLTDEGLRYAANDVRWLQGIMDRQVEDAKSKGCLKALMLENAFTPACAYLEWCGIRLDEGRWRAKMARDAAARAGALARLTSFVEGCAEGGYVSDDGRVSLPASRFRPLLRWGGGGDLFAGTFDDGVSCTVEWTSAAQVTPFLKALGFDTHATDKDTGEDRDSALLKSIGRQRGVCDRFLDAYAEFRRADKAASSYGRNYLNAIDPTDGNVHTQFRAIGTDTGRLSCGSQQTNASLARLKGLPLRTSDTSLKCAYPQLQNLPHDAETRACFVAPEGCLFCSCDYSSIEQRLAADIYDDKAMIDEYLHGSGDIHSLVAKLVHPELAGLTTAEIKKSHKAERQAAKPVGLGINYGASPVKLAETIGCSVEVAQGYYDKYMSHFTGVRDFMRRADAFVKEHGYIPICEETGHKAWWPGWGAWKAREMRYGRAFWEEYKAVHKGTGDAVCKEVREHMREGSAWSRKAVNTPCQGLSAVITKTALTMLFDWIASHGLFGEVRIVDAVHDEICVTFPERLRDVVPAKLKELMEKAGNHYCKKVPVVAEPEVSDHWVH